MENAEERDWVARQLAWLDTPVKHEPDAAAALARFHARTPARRRLWPAWAAAAVLAVGTALLLPPGRVAAQQLWQFLTVRRVGFIRVKAWPEGVPSPKVNLIGTIIPPIPARDAAEAAWRVQYVPRLPPSGVLDGTPRISTTFSMAAGTVVHVADLQLALQKAGVTDETAPAQWDGAQVALHSSAVVIAEWPDILLAQSLPLTLSAPPGFDFTAFSAIVLRVLGVGQEEASRLSQRMGNASMLLAPVDRNFDERGTIEEITLNAGPATLVQAPQKVSVVWSVPDRVYVLSGKLSRELAIAAANSVQ